MASTRKSTKRTIRELRLEKKWSQRKLSVLLDVTITTVQDWENNRVEPRLSQAQKVLDAFDVEWDEVEWPAKKYAPAA